MSSHLTALTPSFSGHETFVFRYSWLKKGIDAFAADPEVFRKESAIVTLGVGKNMVNSIRHWCIAARLLEEGDLLPGSRTRPLQISRLGHFLFRDDAGDDDEGFDSFLEDDATLWLIHWHLATNTQKATSWYWAFNLLRENEFTRDSLQEALAKRIQTQKWGNVSESTLKSDLSCFLRTYLSGRRGSASTPDETTDCPLVSLGLLVGAEGEGVRYRFNNKPKPNLPTVAFAYALWNFWRTHHSNQTTLALRSIVHDEGSPGRVFRLDEDATLMYLDAIETLTDGAWTFVDTALIQQITERRPIDPFHLLQSYYARR